MKKPLALMLVLPLAGCAGGQPRMATQTANQAEDQERPFVEMTPEQAVLPPLRV
ncbi:MAG TPA: hypothetical protein VIF11_04245 [Methylomirabilota bacterium]|jgi:hypothetical protein